jgi:hypothetical protein
VYVCMYVYTYVCMYVCIGWSNSGDQHKVCFFFRTKGNFFNMKYHTYEP